MLDLNLEGNVFCAEARTGREILAPKIDVRQVKFDTDELSCKCGLGSSCNIQNGSHYLCSPRCGLLMTGMSAKTYGK